MATPTPGLASQTSAVPGVGVAIYSPVGQGALSNCSNVVISPD